MFLVTLTVLHLGNFHIVALKKKATLTLLELL